MDNYDQCSSCKHWVPTRYPCSRGEVCFYCLSHPPATPVVETKKAAPDMGKYVKCDLCGHYSIQVFYVDGDMVCVFCKRRSKNEPRGGVSVYVPNKSWMYTPSPAVMYYREEGWYSLKYKEVSNDQEVLSEDDQTVYGEVYH